MLWKLLMEHLESLPKNSLSTATGIAEGMKEGDQLARVSSKLRSQVSSLLLKICSQDDDDNDDQTN